MPKDLMAALEASLQACAWVSPSGARCGHVRSRHIGDGTCLAAVAGDSVCPCPGFVVEQAVDTGRAMDYTHLPTPINGPDTSGEGAHRPTVPARLSSLEEHLADHAAKPVERCSGCRRKLRVGKGNVTWVGHATDCVRRGEAPDAR